MRGRQPFINILSDFYLPDRSNAVVSAMDEHESLRTSRFGDDRGEVCNVGHQD